MLLHELERVLRRERELRRGCASLGGLVASAMRDSSVSARHRCVPVCATMLLHGGACAQPCSPRLAGIVGEAHVLTAPADVEPYRRRSGAAATTAARCAVVRPRTTDEVAAVVRACAESGVADRPARRQHRPVRRRDARRDRRRRSCCRCARMNRVRAIDRRQRDDHRRSRRAARRGAGGRAPTPACSFRCRSRPKAAARSAATSRPTPAAPRCCAIGNTRELVARPRSRARRRPRAGTACAACARTTPATT